METSERPSRLLRIAEQASVRVLRRDFRNLPARLWLRLGGARAARGKLDYPAADIYLSLTSRTELQRLSSCSKEPWTVNWIEEWIGPGDVLYDIGANVGAYALVAAKRSRGQTRVVALEPGYASFAALCANVVLNGCADSIVPLPIALSSRTGLADFAYSDVRPGAAYHTSSSPVDGPDHPVAYRQPMLSYRLDDLIDEFRLPPPNHVKLDVDGAEVDVLRGAEQTITGLSFKSLIVEVENERSDEINRLLADYGLALHTRFDQRRGAPSHVWYGLFTPRAS